MMYMIFSTIIITHYNIVLQLQPGAAGFQISNPPVFSLMPLVASLEVWANDECGLFYVVK